MKPLLAVVLFGFVHSGSKLILQTGISLLSFCLLYSGFRLLTQLPFILINKLYIISLKQQLFLLLVMGLLGGALQVCEFQGIASGVSVGAVTFIIYAYPIWTLIFSVFINKEKINLEIVRKIILSLAGIFLIIESSLSHFNFSFEIIYPLVASLLMALWISLSNLAKNRNLNSWTLSFYYDLFSFMTILYLILFRESKPIASEMMNWLSHGQNILYISVYSIIFGVIPNILFYDASKYISAMKASLFLLFEPIISSLISWIIWQDSLGAYFWLGAILILVSNLPFGLIANKFTKKVGFYEQVN